jgi:hypothetical protein
MKGRLKSYILRKVRIQFLEMRLCVFGRVAQPHRLLLTGSRGPSLVFLDCCVLKRKAVRWTQPTTKCVYHTRTHAHTHHRRNHQFYKRIVAKRTFLSGVILTSLQLCKRSYIFPFVRSTNDHVNYTLYRQSPLQSTKSSLKPRVCRQTNTMRSGNDMYHTL